MEIIRKESIKDPQITLENMSQTFNCWKKVSTRSNWENQLVFLNHKMLNIPENLIQSKIWRN